MIKILTIFLSSFVVLLIGYFFYSFNKQQFLENSIKCQEIGMKLYSQEVKDNDLILYFAPEFKFIKSLNTCLYKNEYTYTTGKKTYTYFIRDIYTNKDLAYYTQGLFVEDTETPFQETGKGEYELLVKKYFKE